MAGKRWNGSTWVDHTTKKRWNGSTWVTLTTAKRWNGSTWVDIYAGGGGGSLTFTPSDSIFSDGLFCDGNSDSCPLSDSQSDTITYVVSGGTGPYTVTPTQFSGDAVTVSHNAGGLSITVSTTVGRSSWKRVKLKW